MAKQSIKKIDIPVFQVIAEVAKVETMESGMKMVIYTNEVAPTEMAMLMTLKGKQGNLLFAPAKYEFTEEDLEDLPEIELEKGEKHPSIRMRNIIYRLWEQNGGNNRPDKKTSQEYYKEQMERLNNLLKEKLDPTN